MSGVWSLLFPVYRGLCLVRAGDGDGGLYDHSVSSMQTASERHADDRLPARISLRHL